MNRIAISTIIATAITAIMTVSANAACNVSGNIVTFTLTGQLNESDCASAAIVTSQGAAITTLQGDVGTLQTTAIDHEGRIVILETDSTAHGLAITALQSGHAAQQAQIDDHETRLDDNDVKNGEQDDAIEVEKVRNDGQDTVLATHTSQIGSLETVTAEHETRLDAHDTLLSEHDATLSSHGDRLDDHAKGLAISMAMPDAWLSDSKSFGFFGSVGGFEDQTAIGFAAIGRIDENWSINGKLGADTNFDHVGWQAGFGAQW